MKHVFYKRYSLGYKKGKITHQEFIEPHKHKVVTLSSFKEIENFLRIGFLSLLFLLCPASLAAAPTLPIDFVRNQIWFSKQPFTGGEQVKIYTSVFNGSAADARGAVEFYDNKTLLGTAQFSAVAGGSQIVFIRWTASSGDHAFRAKITSIRAVYPDGREENLPDISTGSTVNVVVQAPSPVVSSAAKPTSVSGILRAMDPGPATATSTVSEKFLHRLVGAASSTDAFVDETHAKLEAAKRANDKILATAKAAEKIDSSKAAKTNLAAAAASEGGSAIATPFRMLYSYLLQFLTFVFAHKIILYLLAAYLLYKAARSSLRRFFRPAV